jgi:hypothetical protein
MDVYDHILDENVSCNNQDIVYCTQIDTRIVSTIQQLIAKITKIHCVIIEYLIVEGIVCIYNELVSDLKLQMENNNSCLNDAEQFITKKRMRDIEDSECTSAGIIKRRHDYDSKQNTNESCSVNDCCSYPSVSRYIEFQSILTSIVDNCHIYDHRQFVEFLYSKYICSNVSGFDITAFDYFDLWNLHL